MERTETEILLKANNGTTDRAWQVVTTEMGRKRSLSTVEDPAWTSLFAFLAFAEVLLLFLDSWPLLTQRKMAMMLKFAAKSIALGR